MKIVLVAEGCIRGNERGIEEIRRLVRDLQQAGLLVTITHAVFVPDLGCGKLLAVVGPRGGVHEVFFVREGKGVVKPTKAMLRHFEPEKIHDQHLYEKIMKKAKR